MNRLAVFCLLFYLVLSSVAGQEKKEVQVLVLNSYHPQYEWTRKLVSGVQNVLEKEITIEDIHVEYMDARRFADDLTYEAQFYDLLKYKYASAPPDLIISSDDFALDFIFKYRDGFFKGIPVVFCGINVPNPKKIEKDGKMTGIFEGVEIQKNLDLIEEIQPNVKEIILLTDNTTLGKSIAKQAQAALNKRKSGSIQYTLISNFTIPALQKLFKEKGENTAIFILVVLRGEDGIYFSYAKDLPLISKNSKAPIFGMWGSLMLGKGVVGGYMNDPVRHGEKAAILALQIINGRNASEIPIKQKATFEPVFDYNLLQKFNINPDQLPANSTVINLPYSFFKQNKQLVLFISAMLVLLIVVIILLILLLRRKRKGEKIIQKMNSELEHRIRLRTRDLVKSQSELKLLMAQKDKFFSIVSHDLKSPINSLAGLIHLMGVEHQSNPSFKLEGYLDKLDVTSRNLQQLTHNLLEWARIQMDSIKFQPEIITLHELIAKNIELLTPIAKEKRIKLTISNTSNDKIFADTNMVNSVIQNLITNAIKFTKVGGAILVTTEDENSEWVQMKVVDNGIGMSDTIKKGLFNIESQQSRMGTSNEPGTGLGLLLCYEFVVKNNGSIEVVSQEGVGTTFIVNWPIMK